MCGKQNPTAKAATMANSVQHPDSQLKPTELKFTRHCAGYYKAEGKAGQWVITKFDGWWTVRCNGTDIGVAGGTLLATCKHRAARLDGGLRFSGYAIPQHVLDKKV